VSPEQRIPPDRPWRAIRHLVDEVLRNLSRDFDALYAKTGRPSIPPERMHRAQLL
jgi:transposase